MKWRLWSIICCCLLLTFPGISKTWLLSTLFGTTIALNEHAVCWGCWAEARLKIARMTLTIKLDGNWSSFQLANSAPPLSVTDSAIAPSARIVRNELNSDLKICLSAQHEDQNLLASQSHFVDFDLVTPKGVLSPGMCRPSTTREGLWASPRGHLPQKN